LLSFSSAQIRRVASIELAALGNYKKFRCESSINAIAERFFEEDRLVGTWRPWFNIDSERRGA